MTFDDLQKKHGVGFHKVLHVGSSDDWPQGMQSYHEAGASTVVWVDDTMAEVMREYALPLRQEVISASLTPLDEYSTTLDELSAKFQWPLFDFLRIYYPDPLAVLAGAASIITEPALRAIYADFYSEGAALRMDTLLIEHGFVRKARRWHTKMPGGEALYQRD